MQGAAAQRNRCPPRHPGVRHPAPPLPAAGIPRDAGAWPGQGCALNTGSLETLWGRGSPIPASLHPCVSASLHPFIPKSLNPCIPSSLCPFIPVSLHSCIPSSLNPFIPASLHPCVPSSLRPFIPASLHPCVPAFLCSFIPSSLCPCISVSLNPCIPASLRSCIPASLHPCSPPSIHPCIPAQCQPCFPQPMPTSGTVVTEPAPPAAVGWGQWGQGWGTALAARRPCAQLCPGCCVSCAHGAAGARRAGATAGPGALCSNPGAACAQRLLRRPGAGWPLGSGGFHREAPAETPAAKLLLWVCRRSHLVLHTNAILLLCNAQGHAYGMDFLLLRNTCK